MNQTAVDQKMREELNVKYKDRVNELCHWDLNVIDWKIIITKWWWSNNRIVFPDENQLSMYLDWVEWQVHISQRAKYQEDLKLIITECDYYISEIKQTPECFHEDRDDELVDCFRNFKKVLSKYVD